MKEPTRVNDIFTLLHFDLAWIFFLSFIVGTIVIFVRLIRLLKIHLYFLDLLHLNRANVVLNLNLESVE